MKTIYNKTGAVNKAISGILVMTLVFILLLPSINKTKGELESYASNDAILHFEEADLVTEIHAFQGMEREDLALPKTLIAYVEQDTGISSPDGGSTVSSLTSTVTSLLQPTTVEKAIPVRWIGHYNGNEPGTYVLTAQFDNFEYHGEMPIAIVTVEEQLLPMGGPMRSPGWSADHTIDIGTGPPTLAGVVPHPNETRDGFKVSTLDTSRLIEFDTGANGYSYEIKQTGNSQGYWTINVPTNVNTTIVLNGINASLYIHLYGTAHLTILLVGDNVVTSGYFTVREDSSLTIDSAIAPNSGSTSGSLSISSPGSNYAGIGGYYTSTSRSDSGLITINGGTLTVMQTYSGSGVVESAAIGGAYHTNGNIVINGGIVNASGPTSVNSYGAAIGGGRGGTGNVKINGGIITATVPINGTGAAIGGGQGSGNRDSGTGNVTITGGTIYAYSRNGAAIGGGERSSNAKVDISGSSTYIEAVVSGTGSAIGGGGGATGNNVTIIDGFNLNVKIQNGTFHLKTQIGSGVGHGGYQGASTPNHSEIMSGAVSITGGAFYVDVYEGTGIGTGLDNKVVPELFINSNAYIEVFGRKRTAFAGIYAGDNVANHGYGYNRGDAYFVNLNFPGASTSETAPLKGGTTLVVTAAGSLTDVIKTFTVPYDSGMFSFTTGSFTSQDFNIYMGSSGSYKQLAHPSPPRPPSSIPSQNMVHNDSRIYSVNETFAYLTQEHIHDSFFRSLPLKAGVGSLDYYLVTEKYVDTFGNPIVPSKPDTFSLVSATEKYSKTVPNDIDGYKAVGFKWNDAPNGNDFDRSLNIDSLLSESKTVYFIYSPYTEVDITVSKTVSAGYGSTSRSFNFKVYFANSDGDALETGRKFSFEGGIIPDEGASKIPNGEISLILGGIAEFSLKHGQTITIKGVPSDAQIKVIEVREYDYSMSYTDSAYLGITYTEEMKDYSTVGTASRRFDFINVRIPIPPTGLNEDTNAILLFSLTATAMIITSLAIASLIKRKLRLR